MQVAVEYDASSDARSNGEKDEVFGVLCAACPLLPDGRHVDVVVDGNWYMQLFLDERA